VNGAAPTHASAETATPERHDERHVRFLCWLIGVSAAAAPGPEETPALVIGPLLERLDEVIASDALRANLLPRAPHVVPQLMKTLRDESYSSVDVASRISRDVVLSAEVIRSATSAYRAKEDDDAGEIDLARAVAMIGTAGLRRAIASVVLRPIFDAGGDTLSAKAAVKIWRDADRKARLSAALAGQQSLDPFDGYLAGLLHNSGWTAELRAIDGFEDLIFGNADLAHPAVVPELLRRRDALFGAIVGPWNLSPAMDRLADEVGKVGLDAARSQLGIALREANRLAALYALAPAGHRPAAAVPGWATLSRPVQDCYAGLAKTG
jgi:HD-like signal output (HDOD) protein